MSIQAQARNIADGYQPEAATGVCRSRGLINVLDLPSWKLAFHTKPAANLIQNAHGWMKPENTDMWGEHQGSIGGKVPGSPDGKTYCCPADSTYAVAKIELDFNQDTLRNVHCCSGPAPRDRYDAMAKYKAGCYGGVLGSAIGRGAQMTGYAKVFQLDVVPYAADEGAGFEEAAEAAGPSDAAGADDAHAFGGEGALAEGAVAGDEAGAFPFAAPAEHLL
eukprot:tig00021365_g20822.t1